MYGMSGRNHPGEVAQFGRAKGYIGTGGKREIISTLTGFRTAHKSGQGRMCRTIMRDKRATGDGDGV